MKTSGRWRYTSRSGFTPYRRADLGATMEEDFVVGRAHQWRELGILIPGSECWHYIVPLVPNRGSYIIAKGACCYWKGYARSIQSNVGLGDQHTICS
jgi:hypothetical protein